MLNTVTPVRTGGAMLALVNQASLAIPRALHRRATTVFGGLALAQIITLAVQAADDTLIAPSR